MSTVLVSRSQKIQEIGHLDAGELAMQELANRQAAPIVGCHHDLACPQSVHHRRQGIIRQSSGVGDRVIDEIGTLVRTSARRSNERNWHKVFVFSGLDQPGDPRRLRSVA